MLGSDLAGPGTGERLDTVPGVGTMNIVAVTAALWGVGAMPGTPRLVSGPIIPSLPPIFIPTSVALTASSGSSATAAAPLTDSSNLNRLVLGHEGCLGFVQRVPLGP